MTNMRMTMGYERQWEMTDNGEWQEHGNDR